MKRGQRLVVQAINGQGQGISLPLPLNDFGKAYDGPPSVKGHSPPANFVLRGGGRREKDGELMVTILAGLATFERRAFWPVPAPTGPPATRYWRKPGRSSRGPTTSICRLAAMGSVDAR